MSSGAASITACALALAFAAALAACGSGSSDSIGDGAGAPASSGATPSTVMTLSSLGFEIQSRSSTPLGGEGVVAYDVRNPLFSDYAVKSRVIKLPAGQAMRFTAEGAFDLPVGAVVAKSFGYPSDSGGVKWIETRVLVHEAAGWRAYELVWNEAQSDAVRKPQGETTELAGVHGLAPKTYALPNESDCSECHGRERIAPIGLRADQLQRDDQLARWVAAGVLREAPSADAIPHAPAWNDPATGSIADRARAYLDANCAHCHREGGSAQGTGLFLGRAIDDPGKLGMCKTAKGIADAPIDVVPGRPEDSLLVRRMRATDEAMRMPPIGRTLPHEEALSLVEEWIRGTPGACASE